LRNGESLYTEYAYDKDKNLTFLKTVLGTEVLAENRYLYDGNGNRTQKEQMQGAVRGLTAYHYDSLNRLSAVEYPGRKEELLYDRAGNRTGRILDEVEERYSYDRRNRLVSYERDGAVSRYEYDAAGNLLRDDRTSYTYDAFNRQTKAEMFDGNIEISRYDAEGLRHEMEENGRLVQFIFRDKEVVTEEREAGTVRYIRTHELLASDAEHARTYYHYASDEMGTGSWKASRKDRLLVVLFLCRKRIFFKFLLDKSGSFGVHCIGY
jgi:YD repeat-containing protein